ncbi:MAG: hypothetical protein AB7O65_04880 [Candidatus Korobacteraceae bacterium]
MRSKGQRVSHQSKAPENDNSDQRKAIADVHGSEEVSLFALVLE